MEPRSRYAFFLLIFTGLLTTSCSDVEVTENAPGGTYPVTNPIVIDTIYTRDYVADVQAVKRVEVRARVKGYIEKVFVDEGEFVSQGTVLFRLGRQEYEEDLLKERALLKSAIAEMKASEVELQNTRKLVEKNVISPSELAIANAKLDALKAKVEEARSHEASALLRLSLTEVKAPFAGVVDRMPYKAGSLVDEETILTTISDNSSVFAYFHVSEKEYLEYSEAVKKSDRLSEVSLILADNSTHPETGKIETIEGEFDRNTGSIAFRARFPNHGHILKHGSSGKVRLRQEVNNALVIPQKSAFEIQDKIYVYAVDENNEVIIKSFIPKMRIPKLYVVESGLTPKDEIIYEGIQNLQHGMKIKTEEISLPQVMHQL